MQDTTRDGRPAFEAPWGILIGLLLGIGIGAIIQGLDAEAWIGLRVSDDPGRFPGPPPGVRVVSVAGGSPAARAGIEPQEFVSEATVGRGAGLVRHPIGSAGDLEALVAQLEVGDVLTFTTTSWFDAAERKVAVTAAIAPSSARARALRPFVLIADLFMTLLAMLIVPIVLASIVTGVAGLRGSRDLGRLSAKTFGYYIATSLIAIVTGLVLVNAIAPGVGAEIGLTPEKGSQFADVPPLWEIFLRIVPTNVFASFTDNRAMLQVIFFGLLLGYVITRLEEPHRGRLAGLFEAFFAAMMGIARIALKLIPIGVLALVAKVVGETGLRVFGPLLVFMATVVLGLLIHGVIVLPLLVRFLGRARPLAHAKAVSPALATAFFTSSSSVTLPVTMRSVHERAGVSKRVSGFVLPLGATINMDGTALYECVGVMFLAQSYASLPGSGFELTFGGQILIVVTALLASIGAAGVPSAGLVMMLTILAALGLPLEGAALLLAVDRPLDMMRTCINIWSDTCGAAIIARSEGEILPTSLAAASARGGGP